MKVLNKMITIISIVLIIFSSIYIYQVLFKKQDFGNILGYTVFKIATGSMEPTIKIGDTVIVKITNNIKTNDIIVYSINDNYVCHRVNKMVNDIVVCKGDNNNIEDDEISINRIIGKVIYII